MEDSNDSISNEKSQFLFKMTYDIFNQLEQDTQWTTIKGTVIFAALITFNGAILSINLNYLNTNNIFYLTKVNIYFLISFLFLIAYYILCSLSFYKCFMLFKTKKYKRINFLENLETYKNKSLNEICCNFLDKQIKGMYERTFEIHNKEILPNYKSALNYFSYSIIIYTVFIILIAIGG